MERRKVFWFAWIQVTFWTLGLIVARIIVVTLKEALIAIEITVALGVP